MAKPTAQQCHALTTYFVSSHKEQTGKDIVVNRNSARYGFEGLLLDFSPQEARELIDYYISKYEPVSLVWFLYNYEKVALNLKEKRASDAQLVIRRQQTQIRLDEWRKRWQ